MRPGRPWGTLCPSAEHTRDRDPCCCLHWGMLLPCSIPPKICYRSCPLVKSVVPTLSATAAVLAPSPAALPCLRALERCARGCGLRLLHRTPQPAECVQRAGGRAAASNDAGCPCASEAQSAQTPTVVITARNAGVFLQQQTAFA